MFKLQGDNIHPLGTLRDSVKNVSSSLFSARNLCVFVHRRTRGRVLIGIGANRLGARFPGQLRLNQARFPGIEPICDWKVASYLLKFVTPANKSG